MIFFDTSVLVAGLLTSHPFHPESMQCMAHISKDKAACASHTFAEVYVTLTRQQHPHKVAPMTAAVMVEKLATRIKPISLSPAEYVEVIRSMAAQGMSGAILYDALLLASARKCEANRIYTLNVKHFSLVAGDLAPRIATP